MRDENKTGLHQPPPVHLMTPSAPPPPPKKRRNRPGNPNPDAEVVALSPTTLMATNRFVCEVCSKGFQREQNLQLHRRGHNLPWKLKQKQKGSTKRKVYLCPEPGCTHHDPARALGDLTGIKKHYSRKHGEKKYKCDKCAKKYAVQSDRKAHSKTCGTKEYRCHCGTLFSRRDSFITHRAFCDSTLAQESMVDPPPPPSFSSISTHLLGIDHHQYHLSINQDLLTFGSRGSSQFATFVGSGFRPSSLSQDMGPADPCGILGLNNNKSSTSSSLHGLMQLPQLQINNNNNNNNNNIGFFPENSIDRGHHSGSGQVSNNLFTSGNLMSMAIPSLYSNTTSSTNIETASAHMSATALLQKAAQLGSTTSNNNNPHHMQDLVGASSASMFGGLYDDDEYRRFHAISSNYNKVAFDDRNLQGHNGNNYDDPSGGWLEQAAAGRRFTRDFLGVGAGIVRNNVVAREQYNAVEMTALDHSIQERSSATQSHSHSFGGDQN